MTKLANQRPTLPETREKGFEEVATCETAGSPWKVAFHRLMGDAGNVEAADGKIGELAIIQTFKLTHRDPVGFVTLILSPQAVKHRHVARYCDGVGEGGEKAR